MIHSLSRTQQRLLGGVAVAVVFLCGVSGVAVAAGEIGTEATEPIVLQQDTTSSEASTAPPHRNPQESDDEGDLDQVESVLRGSMDDSLDSSSAQLDAGDYDQARQHLGSTYTDDLSRYEDLSGDLGTDQEAELYGEVRSDQQQYIDAVEAYERTEQEYEQAREAGETDRARELAHELTERAETVDRTGARLESTYETLDDETDSEHDDRLSEIETRRSDVEDTESRVTDTELTETTLSVRADQSTVTFQEPLTLSGELQTADGTAPGHEEIRLRVGDQTYTTALDTDGGFDLSVEPATVWVETDTLAVEYRPASSSELQASEATLQVSVDSTPTTVDINTASENGGYDEPVTATGVVTTDDGEAVAGAPVALQVDDQQIESAETTADGEFSFDQPLPPDVSTGETDLTVGVLPSELALDTSTDTTPLAVESTPTTVSVDATAGAAGDKIQLNGSVQSAGGRPVAETAVQIEVAGAEVGVVETDADGSFSELAELPAGSTGERVEVTASLEPTGNLEADSDSTAVDVPQRSAGERGVIRPSQMGILAFVGLVGLVGGVGWWLRQQPTTADGTTDAGVSTAADSIHKRQLLAAAADRLNEGADEEAATLAYVAVRHDLHDRVDSSETATHWEWYQACLEAGIDRGRELETLTEAFEKVTFAPDGEKRAAASHAVTVAQTVVDTNEKNPYDDRSQNTGGGG